MDREQLSQQIIENVSRLQRAIPASLWEKSGLSRAQAGLLYVLYHLRAATMKELADHLVISRSAVTQLSEPLLAKGLLAREVDSKDRRQATIKLTGKGQRMVQSLQRQKMLALQTALSALSDKDLTSLAKIYDKMINNIKNKENR